MATNSDRLQMEEILQRQKQCHGTSLAHLHVHRPECERLCQRIDRLIDPLERLEHGSSTLLRDETRNILEEFLRLIDESNEFIEKCQVEFDAMKFVDLQRRFDEMTKDFLLALNIEQLFARTTTEDILRKKQNGIRSVVKQTFRRSSSTSYANGVGRINAVPTNLAARFGDRKRMSGQRRFRRCASSDLVDAQGSSGGENSPSSAFESNRTRLSSRNFHVVSNPLRTRDHRARRLRGGEFLRHRHGIHVVGLVVRRVDETNASRLDRSLLVGVANGQIDQLFAQFDADGFASRHQINEFSSSTARHGRDEISAESV